MKKQHFLFAATAIALTLSAGAQAQSVDQGKQVYQQCAACHSVDGSNGVGPTLKGIYGRQPATVPGFRYSRGMKKATAAWDDKTLDAYLANPQQAVPGNTMPFSGLTSDKDRADVIAYLKTLK